MPYSNNVALPYGTVMHLPCHYGLILPEDISAILPMQTMLIWQKHQMTQSPNRPSARLPNEHITMLSNCPIATRSYGATIILPLGSCATWRNRRRVMERPS